MNINFESSIEDRGVPTSISGEEHGVTKRFCFLEKYVSLEHTCILDIGCGFGAYGNYAMRQGAKSVTGIDINLKHARFKDDSERKVQASALRLPFMSSIFDIALMFEVLEHLPDERQALKEAKRLLKDNGLIYITVPNRFYPFETHGMQLGKTHIKNISGVGIPFLSWMPNFLRKKIERARIYSQKELLRLLLEQGFQPLAVGYIMPPLDRKIRNKQVSNALRICMGAFERTHFRFFCCHLLVLATVSSVQDK